MRLFTSSARDSEQHASGASNRNLPRCLAIFRAVPGGVGASRCGVGACERTRPDRGSTRSSRDGFYSEVKAALGTNPVVSVGTPPHSGLRRAILGSACYCTSTPVWTGRRLKPPETLPYRPGRGSPEAVKVGRSVESAASGAVNFWTVDFDAALTGLVALFAALRLPFCTRF